MLDLPRGSKAVSPTVCLTSAYPTARMMIRDVSGSNGGSVGFSVSYAGTSTANSPLQTGYVQDHRVRRRRRRLVPVRLRPNLDPSTSPGWQLMQITLTANGSKEFQAYNLYLDPMMRD